jgi:hypothetical protein
MKFGLATLLAFTAASMGALPAAADAIQSNVLHVELNQHVYSGGTLDLEYLLSLRLYQGREIEDVTLTASSQGGYAEAQLQLDGLAVGPSKSVGTWTSELDLGPGGQRKIVIDQARRIAIAIRGSAYIRGITVRLSPYVTPGPGTSVVRRSIERRVYDREVFSLRELLGLNSVFRGREVNQVILQTSPISARAYARVLVNGRAIGPTQLLDPRHPSVAIRLPAGRNRLDIDIHTLQVEIVGTVQVHVIGARLGFGIGRDRDREPRIPRLPRDGGIIWSDDFDVY